jgi:hypothetical protein
VKTIRIGCGAGYSGDRIEPAVELAERGDLHYLVFECLAERTIALAQGARLRDPDAGYDPLLTARLRAVLPACAERGVTLVTNMGAANPGAAARAAIRTARELGLAGLRVATIEGDDVLELVRAGGHSLAETGAPVESLGSRLVSANAYIGIEPVLEALAAGADVIVAGRVADPSMFLAPLVHEHGWDPRDWTMLGRGTLVGHLLECAGQVTGGYFADPGHKDVEGLARLGFPLAEVGPDGSAVITKVRGSGGCVTVATCKEQLLYEIHDPSAYVTPDVVADFGQVRVAQDGVDRVRVDGAGGRARPPLLKVSLGYRDGFAGEGQISYGGAGAWERGRLAGEIVVERLRIVGVELDDLRVDLIGADALFGASPAGHEARDVRLRVAGRARSEADAARIGNEVEALYTNGPYGGGGVTKTVREVLGVATTFVPRERVPCTVAIEVV